LPAGCGIPSPLPSRASRPGRPARAPALVPGRPRRAATAVAATVRLPRHRPRRPAPARPRVPRPILVRRPARVRCPAPSRLRVRPLRLRPPLPLRRHRHPLRLRPSSRVRRTSPPRLSSPRPAAPLPRRVARARPWSRRAGSPRSPVRARRVPATTRSASAVARLLRSSHGPRSSRPVLATRVRRVPVTAVPATRRVATVRHPAATAVPGRALATCRLGRTPA
jgi:hypothetical protein